MTNDDKCSLLLARHPNAVLAFWRSHHLYTWRSDKGSVHKYHVQYQQHNIERRVLWLLLVSSFIAEVSLKWLNRLDISHLSHHPRSTLGHLDLHGGWCQCSELFGHSLTDALEHRSATREDHVCVQVLADIHVTSGVYILGSKNSRTDHNRSLDLGYLNWSLGKHAALPRLSFRPLHSGIYCDIICVPSKDRIQTLL